MTAYGSRIPKGGRRGDTYRAYTHISADTDNDIHTLFELAKASIGIHFTKSLFITFYYHSDDRYNQGHC
jgi:hypothetical protein